MLRNTRGPAALHGTILSRNEFNWSMLTIIFSGVVNVRLWHKETKHFIKFISWVAIMKMMRGIAKRIWYEVGKIIGRNNWWQLNDFVCVIAAIEVNLVTFQAKGCSHLPLKYSKVNKGQEYFYLYFCNY